MGIPRFLGFPLVSAALLVYPVHRRSLEYQSSSFFVFEIRTVRWHRPPSSIAKVWSVKSCMLCLDSLRVETAMKATMRYDFDAFGANLQWCLSLYLWGSVNFFWKPCRSNRGPSRNSGWVHKNRGSFEEICWAQTRNFGHGGFRKREQSTLHAHLHGHRTAAGQRWFEREKANTLPLAKMQVTVGLWLRMYGYSSLHTNAKARENSKNNYM